MATPVAADGDDIRRPDLAHVPVATDGRGIRRPDLAHSRLTADRLAAELAEADPELAQPRGRELGADAAHDQRRRERQLATCESSSTPSTFWRG
jgi:hypothetical protein